MKIFLRVKFTSKHALSCDAQLCTAVHTKTLDRLFYLTEKRDKCHAFFLKLLVILNSLTYSSIPFKVTETSVKM
jgi:hypothetical protein